MGVGVGNMRQECLTCKESLLLISMCATSPETVSTFRSTTILWFKFWDWIKALDISIKYSDPAESKSLLLLNVCHMRRRTANQI